LISHPRFIKMFSNDSFTTITRIVIVCTIGIILAIIAKNTTSFNITEPFNISDGQFKNNLYAFSKHTPQNGIIIRYMSSNKINNTNDTSDEKNISMCIMNQEDILPSRINMNIGMDIHDSIMMFTEYHYITPKYEIMTKCLEQCTQKQKRKQKGQNKNKDDDIFCNCFTTYTKVSITNKTQLYKIFNKRISKSKLCFTELMFEESRSIFDSDKLLKKILNNNPSLIGEIIELKVLDVSHKILQEKILEEFEKDPMMLKYILEQTEQQIISAIERKPETIKFVKNPSYDAKKLAIDNCDIQSTIGHYKKYTREYTREYAKQHTKHIYTHTLADGYGTYEALDKIAFDRITNVIKNIRDLPMDLAENIVNHEGRLLGIIDIRNVTDKMCKLAVVDDPRALEYCPENLQTEKLCWIAINSDKKTLQHCKKPTPKMCNFVLDSEPKLAGKCLEDVYARMFPDSPKEN
jgi:hypothetical protein